VQDAGKHGGRKEEREKGKRKGERGKGKEEKEQEIKNKESKEGGIFMTTGLALVVATPAISQCSGFPEQKVYNF